MSEIKFINVGIDEPPNHGLVINSQGVVFQRIDELIMGQNDVYHWYRPGDMCPQAWLYIVDDPMVVVNDPVAEIQRASQIMDEMENENG